MRLVPNLKIFYLAICAEMCYYTIKSTKYAKNCDTFLCKMAIGDSLASDRPAGGVNA